MRKGSTSLGSLGMVLGMPGIVVLILPMALAGAGAILTPTTAGAADRGTPAARLIAPRGSAALPQPESVQAADTNRAGEEQAVRSALERRAADATLSSRRHAKHKPVKVINTRATWYGPGFHGHRTASGERFNRNAMTLASRHLPMGTYVRVVNPRTGRAALARVNDRGPFRSGYTADLSQALARRIGLGGSGPVRLEVMSKGGS